MLKQANVWRCVYFFSSSTELKKSEIKQQQQQRITVVKGMKREHPGPVSVSVYKCRTSSVYNPTIQDATYVYCLYKYTMKPVINRTFLGPAFICSKWKGVLFIQTE
jgi:hypothetical protein